MGKKFSRRSFGQIAVTAFGTILAGCSGLGATEGDIPVNILSTTDSDVNINVKITSNSEVLLDQYYQLQPQEGDTSTSISKEPDQIQIDIENGANENWQYSPPSGCGDRGNEPGIFITIYSTDDVGLSYGCVSE